MSAARGFRRLFACACICLVPAGSRATDIDVNGNWSRTVDRSDLIAGAGTGLVPAVESAAGIATVDVLNTSGASWVVRVSRSDIDWPVGVGVEIRRSSADSGINGGADYLAINASTQDFFSGSGDRSGIAIQIRITGLSLNTLPSSYSLALVYTVQSPAP